MNALSLMMIMSEKKMSFPRLMMTMYERGIVSMSTTTNRKIAAMHKFFGTTPDKKCGDCPHLHTYRHGTKRWFKCEIYGESASVSTDWVKKWLACGLFDKPAPKGYTSIIRTLKSDPKRFEPVEGQIPMNLEEAEP